MSTAGFLSTPLELLPTIFSYACVDSGTTGCAINLVCKTFREACLDSGVDIQYASVFGLAKLKPFWDMLSKREAEKRKIVSLFLSSHGETDKWYLPVNVRVQAEHGKWSDTTMFYVYSHSCQKPS